MKNPKKKTGSWKSIDDGRLLDYINPMSFQLKFRLSFDQDLDEYLAKNHPEVGDYHILSKSLDARQAPKGAKPAFDYIIEAIKKGEVFEKEQLNFQHVGPLKRRPIIIGAGPAGLFCALRFAEYGIPTTVIERGSEASKRMLAISKFWRYGQLDPETNVCYGEGGAGLFSDGKLITRVKSHHISYVMEKLVQFGAPEETAYISNPHLGSNRIRAIITKISSYLKEQGHVFHYNTRVDQLQFSGNKVTGVQLNNGQVLESDQVILAAGHSAKEMYYHLAENQVGMKAKDFAVGVRVEHERAYIDQIQHGKFCHSEILGAARYRLSYHDKLDDRGSYSFCMCPGGHVLSSGTEANGIVVNGMSNYARAGHWSNSALVVSVKAGVDFPKEDLLAGLKFQHKIEQAAFNFSKKYASGREVPAMTIGEFLKGKSKSAELPKTSCPSGIVKANLADILPDFIDQQLQTALVKFDQQLRGFVKENALLLAPETRTSSPLTVIRDPEVFQSTTHQNLYPCGEGAGYAGGITSAAVDGVKIAEAIVSKYLPQ